jgi:hypothetical protein
VFGFLFAMNFRSILLDWYSISLAMTLCAYAFLNKPNLTFPDLTWPNLTWPLHNSHPSFRI